LQVLKLQQQVQVQQLVLLTIGNRQNKQRCQRAHPLLKMPLCKWSISDVTSAAVHTNHPPEVDSKRLHLRGSLYPRFLQAPDPAQALAVALDNEAQLSQLTAQASCVHNVPLCAASSVACVFAALAHPCCFPAIDEVQLQFAP
jgi:hypothetical protein